MDRIRQLLALLAEPADLSNDELAQAVIELRSASQDFALTADADTVEGTTLLSEVAVVVEATVDLMNEREEADAERAAVRADLLERINGPKAETPPEELPADSGEEQSSGEGEAPAEEPAAEPAEEPAAEPEAIAAATESRPRTNQVPIALLNRTQPVSTKPRVQAEAEARPVIRAAGDLRDFGTNQVLDWDQAAMAMSDRLRGVERDNGPVADLRAGTIDWRQQYDATPERRINGMPTEIIDQRFRAVVGDIPGYDMSVLTPREPGKVASGGICAPVTVRYELEEVSQASRPLRDGLPSFNADRGGIQFNTPPHLVDILADQSSATLTTVTAAQDAAAGTKTVQEAACGTLNTVQVRAICARLQFSNFTDRYNPERMRAFMGLGMAAHSRLAEREILEDMRTASTLTLGGTQEVGAARQLIEVIQVASRAQRYRHRMSEDYPIRCVLPMWVADVIEVDVLKQAPGDNVINGAPIEGENWITEQLASDNIRPIFQLDDARTNNALGAGAPAFTGQTGLGATLQDFPGRAEILLYPEGSFLFLDGGQLDFGITRDSTLNSQNRFQTFFESFEGVAFVGVECLDISVLLCASGAAAALVTTKCGGVGS
jgi:hypothetical protein